MTLSTRTFAGIVAWVAAALTFACGGASAPRNTQKPSLDQVAALLGAVGKAADAGDDKAMRACFEDGLGSDEFAMFKSSKFWTLPMDKRVKRLGPDAFQINLSEPVQKMSNGFMSMRRSIDLPLRWGTDGQLRILNHEEVERLEKLPVPETPGGEPIVELGLPDSGSSMRDTQHFASEFWITTAGDQTTFHIRFDPPLVTSDVVANRPTPEGASSFAGEISVDFYLDADDDPATGTRMDKVYESAGGNWADRAKVYKDFGIDRLLTIDGKKNDAADGKKVWVLDLGLKTYTARPEARGSDTIILTEGEKLTEKTQTDPAVRVESDVLTFTVPTSMAAVKPGGTYRVQLPNNSNVSSSEMLKILRGKVGSS